MEPQPSISERDVITELSDVTDLPGGRRTETELPPLSPSKSSASGPELLTSVHARLPDDVTGPLLYDVTVVEDVVVVTDSLNRKIKAFKVTDGSCLSSMALTHIPLCVAAISDVTVMVTLHQQCELLTFSVLPELRLLDRLPTREAYRGVAALRLPVTAEVVASSGALESTGGSDVTVLCVAAPGCVDLLSMQGALLRSFRFESLSLPLRDPICLAVRPPPPRGITQAGSDVTHHVTVHFCDVSGGFPDGDSVSEAEACLEGVREPGCDVSSVPSLLVSDVEARSLFEILLTGEGRALGDLQKEERPFDWPLGVACDVTGEAYVVDLGNHTVCALRPGDVTPQVLLGRRDGLCFPRGVHVTQGKLYVTQDQDVKVYALQRPAQR